MLIQELMAINEEKAGRQVYRADIDNAEYQKLRKAKMHGDFSHHFTAIETANGRNTVTFKTSNPKKLAADLEKVIDAGETSWAEILNIA